MCEKKRLQDTAEHPAPGFYQVFTKALGQSRISSLMLKESKVGSRRALPRGRTKSPCQRSTIRGFPAKVRTQESIKAEEEVLSVMAAVLGEDGGEGAALRGQSQRLWLSALTPEDLSKHRELSP